MSSLFNAMNAQSRTRTENGMATLPSSGNSFTDLFFQIGAARGQYQVIEPLINRSFSNDRNEIDALGRILLWARDVRGGAGERELFRRGLVDFLRFQSPNLTDADRQSMVNKIPVVGRWDDVVYLVGTEFENFALRTIIDGLQSRNALCAKWLPREKSAQRQTAYKIRKGLGLSRKEYRKLLAELSSTVEQQMCAGAWDNINFSHVPSVASSKYRTAFFTRQPERFAQWVSDVKNKVGDAKVNASAIFPHTIVQDVLRGGMTSTRDAANEQWKALPDYMKGSQDRRILPVVDTSGSMTGGFYGSRSSVVPIEVAVALGIYLAEHNRGVFHNQFITFSEQPELQSIGDGDLSDKVHTVRRAHWGFNTDLAATFNLLLKAAVRENLEASEMPTDILILSDMQFDQACGGQTALEMINQKYQQAGYTRPNIIFWNLRATAGQSPVDFRQDGTALVSGFSPSIMKNILAGEGMSPVDIMLNTIGSDRYDWMADA